MSEVTAQVDRLKGFRLRLKAEGAQGFRLKVRGRRSEHFSLNPFSLIT
jgi:hypothetical protein